MSSVLHQIRQTGLDAATTTGEVTQGIARDAWRIVVDRAHISCGGWHYEGSYAMGNKGLVHYRLFAGQYVTTTITGKRFELDLVEGLVWHAAYLGPVSLTKVPPACNALRATFPPEVLLDLLKLYVTWLLTDEPDFNPSRIGP